MLASMLQNIACVMSFEPRRARTAASGLSSAMPNGPVRGSRWAASPTWRRTAAAACRARRRSRRASPASAPARVRALPVDAADDRRRELRHRGEGDQPDGHQRVGLAGEAEVEVAEQQDRDDRAAANVRAAGRVRSARSREAQRCMRSSTGITRSLQTMVDSAMVSTITMPVAADSPPMNTSSASASCRSRHRQRQHERVGVDAAAGKCSSPPNAIGSTKRLMASM